VRLASDKMEEGLLVLFLGFGPSIAPTPLTAGNFSADPLAYNITTVGSSHYLVSLYSLG